MRLRQVLRKRIGKTWPAPTTPVINVLPSRVTAAQAKATGATAQWTAFKSRLDGQLNSVVPCAFEGGNIPWVADFALGYQCLKGSDPTTANKYADKAVALLTAWSTDYLTGNDTGGWMFLAQGDGLTTGFTLPASPTASFLVAVVPVTAQAVVRGATPNSYDAFPAGDSYYQIYGSNTNSVTGPVDYVRGTDYRQGYCRNDFVDWSPAGAEPTAAATYYLISAYLGNCAHSTLSQGAGAGQYQRTGTALTVNTPPTTAQAVVVQYLWNDGANAYRQTSNGCGGLNNVFIDASFTARYLAQLFCAYDWLYAYPGFTSGLKTTLENFAIQWDSWVRTGTMTPAQPSGPAPYKPASGTLEGLQSNYEAGYYWMRATGAAALGGRRAEAGTMQSNLTTYRTTYLGPNLRDAVNGAYATSFDATFLGGWDVEGWGDYGAHAMSNVLRGSDVLNEAGIVLDISQERAFAGELILAVIHCIAHPSLPSLSLQKGTMYAGGEFGTYPAGVVVRDWLKIWQPLASDATAAAYAAYYVANLTTTSTADAWDLLYRDPNAAATDWTLGADLFYCAQGSSLALSRAAWDYASTYMTLECGDQAITGHLTASPGTLMIWRGKDDLLVCASEFCNAFEDNSKTFRPFHGNLVQVGTAGQTQIGLHYDNAGRRNRLTAFEGTTARTYLECDYQESFYNGTGNPATEVTRAVLHVRPDYVFVYDRVATSTAGTAKQLRWYLPTLPTLTGDGWVIATRGSSKLFGHTYCGSTLTTANDTVTVNGATVNRVTVDLSAVTSPLRYASILQTAPSATAAMDASAFVVSTVGAAMEGVLIGTVLALFGKTKTSAGATGYQVTTPTTYGYTAPGGTLTHYVCDLTPNQTYTLSGAATGTVTASAAGVLTFTTTGSGSQTVTIT